MSLKSNHTFSYFSIGSSSPIFVRNATGQYNPQMVLNYLQNIDQMPRESQLQWFDFEKAGERKYRSKTTTKHWNFIDFGNGIGGWCSLFKNRYSAKTLNKNLAGEFSLRTF